MAPAGTVDRAHLLRAAWGAVAVAPVLVKVTLLMVSPLTKPDVV